MDTQNGKSLLRKAEKQTAYLKGGILGFAGSGKTYTASEIARGIVKLVKSTKPVAFFDTETGSDYGIDKFKKDGIELVVAKSRAFTDLLDVVAEAEKSCDVLIIDSITHVWMELLDSYMKKHKKTRLSVWDWNPIKGEWRRFTDAYLCSRLHILMCGRAGFTYEEYFNEQGEKEIIKTGTKMKAESDMGYEPSLLMEMERVSPEIDPRKKRGSRFVHRCTILKDRTDLMNGKVIDNPKFQDLLPIVNALNLGGEHFVLDTSRTSEEKIQGPDWSYEDRKRMQQIVTEEIEGDLVSAFPGNTKEEKKAKADILQVSLNSRSWTAICGFHPDRLKAGREIIKYLCRQVLDHAEEIPSAMQAGFVDWLEAKKMGMSQGADDDIPDFKTLPPNGEKEQQKLI